MALKHAFVSAKVDGGDTTLVRPSDWNADHVVDKDGILLATGSPDPSAPSSGNLRLFAKNKANRILPNIIGPSGIETSLQPALFGNTQYIWVPGTGTSLSINYGVSWSAQNSGTGAAQSHPTQDSTSALTSLNRASFTTGTTATGASGVRASRAVCYRGNAAGRGGFFFFARFAVDTFASDMRLMIGLSPNAAALAADPSTINHTAGLIKDSADSTWQICMRGAAATKTNTGLTVAAGDILDFYMFAPPNSNSIWCRLLNPITNTVYVDNAEFTSNLPTNTTFLVPQANIQSVSGTTGKILALNKIYAEVDI